MASPFLLQANDSTDIGYNKAIVDALMVVAQGGDRRGFSYSNPAGSYAYLGVNRVAYPRTYLNTDTAPVCTGIVRSPAATDVAVAAAIAAANPGDWVVQQVGTYTATYVAPNKAGDALPGGTNVISIIGKQVYDSIVAGEPTVLPRLKRIADADKAGMPYFKNVSLANQEQWAFNGATAGFRFIGIRFGVDPTVSALSRLVRVGNGDGSIQTGPASSPQNVGFDRCHFDGHATLNLKAALELHGRGLFVTECYFGDDIHHNGQDCKATSSYNGPGPYRLVNSRFCASSENWMWGGAYTTVGSVPRDIEIRWNLMEKPAKWNPAHPTYDGSTWNVKNLSEIKKAKNVLIEGNYYRRSWAAAQVGAVLNCKSESYGDGPQNGYTSDVLFRWNFAEQSGYGVGIAGVGNTDAAVAPANVFLVGNLIVLGEQYYSAAAQGSFIGMGLLSACGAVHNTFIAKGIVLNIAPPGGGQNGLVLLDNIFGRTSYGLKGPSVTEGTATLAAYAAGPPIYDVRKNLFTGRPASYPATNSTPVDEAAIQFTNYAGGDYSLSGNTPVIPPPPPATAVASSFVTDIAPSGGNSGSPLGTQPRFKLLDQYSALFPQSSGTVTASIIAGQGSITAGATAPFVNGRAQYAGLTFVTPVSNDLTVRFTPSNGMAPIDIVISTVAAVGMGILTPASDGVDGVPLPTQPKIQMLDAVGAPLALAGVVVTAAVKLAADGAVVAGATATTNGSGQAQFVGLTIDVTADAALELRYSAIGAMPVDEAVNIVAAPDAPVVATQLVCTREPSGARRNRPLRQEPRYEWQDDHGRLATTETASVTLRVEGNARTIGTTTLPAIGGVVDFAGSGFGIDGRGHVTIIAEGTP